MMKTKLLFILTLFASCIFANPFEDLKNASKRAISPPSPNPFKHTTEIKASELDMKYQVYFFGVDINWACQQMTILSKQWDKSQQGITFVPPPSTKDKKNLVKYKWTTNSKTFIDVIKEIGDKFNVTWKFESNKVLFEYIKKDNE
jgi:hypothetical protein